MKRALGLLMLLSACASASSRPVMGPDGKQWWFITCRHGQDNCLDEAAELCPYGYVMGNAEEHDGPTAFISNGAGGGYLVSHRRGSMTVRCHAGAPTPDTAAYPPLERQ